MKVLLTAVLLAICVGSAAAHEAPVMTLRLKDLSFLTAVIESETISLAAPYGKVMLQTALVDTLERGADGVGFRVKMKNGDMISGEVCGLSLRVQHALGPLVIPWREVVAMKSAKGPPWQAPSRRSVTSAIKFEVVLNDGSVISASPKATGVALGAAFGTCRLPWAWVRGVSFQGERDGCLVLLWSGDVIAGRIAWSANPVSTGLGVVTISPENTSRFSVSLGGADLVAKPSAAVSGSRYFLAAVKNSSPRRIGGRLLQPSQFIEAHASGRIEYEFAEPITEFHAIATMYESYCGHKGNVIFRVETEHGEVYSTRALRNLQREKIYVRFAPSRKLILITDQNGSADEDWSVWLRPEVR